MRKFEEYIPDKSVSTSEAYARTTTLSICAHQDDVEFITYKGILDCYDSANDWFSAVVVTNGAGSPRSGKFANFTDAEMVDVRYMEQKKAADIGKYSFLNILGYTSAETKDATNPKIISELVTILDRAKPEIVYTHNILDRHDTHVAVALRTISAIRNLPKEQRPKKLYGGEMWRSLDWLHDDLKVSMPIEEDNGLALRLMNVYESQIAGGKNYAVAVDNRRVANATLGASHKVDVAKRIAYYLDMTPLIEDDSIDIKEYAQSLIDSFKDEAKKQLDFLYNN